MNTTDFLTIAHAIWMTKVTLPDGQSIKEEAPGGIRATLKIVNVQWTMVDAQ